MGKLDKEDEEFSEDEFEYDPIEEDEEEDEEVVDTVESQSKTAEEIEKQRLARIEQKNLIMQRKLAKPNADIILQAKQIWEKLRAKQLSKNERTKLMNEMMGIVKGKALDIIYKHDASRIIQCCVKYGNSEQRDEIAKELQGHYSKLSQSKYGRFIVSKLLQYCPKYRNAVIIDFYGKVRKLVRHKEASIVLDEAYSQYANSSQRSALMEEFYGPEFVIFKNDKGTRSLEELIKANPLKKPYILKHMRSAIDSVLEKATFNLGKTPILHRAIFDYVTLADESVSKDMIEYLKDHLVHMLHTREGAQITQYCILHATPKDRKAILKSLKGFVHSIAKEQYGQSVLLSCFECVDDTVLVGKTIINELFQPPSAEHSVNELLRDQYGSRVILFLLCGRNKRYQPSYLIEELKASDEIRSKTSKKDSAVKHQELLEIVSPLLIEQVGKYSAELLRTKNGSIVLVETCNNCTSLEMLSTHVLDQVLAQVKKSAKSSLVGLLKPEDEEDEGSFNVVKKMKAESDKQKQLDQGINLNESVLVSRSATLALKLLIQKPKEEGSKLPEWKDSFIASIWSLLSENIEKIMKHCSKFPRVSSGLAFILVALYENGGNDIQSEMKDLTKGLKSGLESNLKSALAKKPTTPEDKKKRKRNTDEKPSKSGMEILMELLS
ncbi:armadillo-type protein [Globomyces pollinis-pini]|nr:armadillo-type protein [Globomyces pollinis-pini]